MNKPLRKPQFPLIDTSNHKQRLIKILFHLQENSYGKSLMYYALKSKDDENLLAFLIPKFSGDSKAFKNKFYMKMQNQKFLSITGKTFFEYYLFLCINGEHRDFFTLISYFLEEIETIKDIQHEIAIENLLNFASDANSEETARKKYFVDDLLANILVYWSTSDPNYELYKEKFLLMSPFFEMMLSIIEGDEEEFTEKLSMNLDKLEKSYSERYFDSSNDACYTSNFLSLLFFAAFKNDRREIIEKLLSYDVFDISRLRISEQMLSNGTQNFVASKLLEQGHEISSSLIPTNWISPQNLEKFLDSRIKYFNDEMIQIDCSFLVQPCNRMISDEDSLIDDVASLNYIVHTPSLKRMITHPVLSTFTDLKSLSHRRVDNFNIFYFLLFYIIPIIVIIRLDLLLNAEFYFYAMIFLLARILFQYYVIDKSMKKYLGNMMNLCESALLVQYIFMMFYSSTVDEEENNSSDVCVKMMKLTYTFLPIVSAYSLLPNTFFFVAMIMLRKVIKTFTKFFRAYIFVLITLALAFGIIFEGTVKTEEDDGGYGRKGPKFNASSDDSFMKEIMMMIGNFDGIEVDEFSTHQYLSFLLIIAFNVILFNLILALTINDVQQMFEDSKYLRLKQSALSYLTTVELFARIFNMLR